MPEKNDSVNSAISSSAALCVPCFPPINYVFLIDNPCVGGKSQNIRYHLLTFLSEVTQNIGQYLIQLSQDACLFRVPPLMLQTGPQELQKVANMVHDNFKAVQTTTLARNHL